MTTDETPAVDPPKPIPRPGPARPTPRPHPPAQPLAVPPVSDPHRFGRVADDGTVYLLTPSGERVIGSWQAGEPEAAFAHFGRRFDDLATEITLMETRLASGTADARKIKTAAAALAESLPTANVLGDLDALTARLAAIADHAEETAQAERARREEQRAQQTARKEALAAEAEDLAANATQWKTAGDRMRAILDEWRTITGLDRKTDDALWKRYSAARDAFNRRRGAHFSELDRERAGARETKERLCARAEELSGSTDWAATATKFRDLLAEWKAAGRAAKDVDDALWHRFKAAQDTFFAAKNSDLEKRSESMAENLGKKESLVAEIETLLPISNLDEARRKFRDLKGKYIKTGMVERNKRTALDRRIDVVEMSLKEAEQEQWRRSDPGAKARASDVVNQLLAAVADYEAKAARAEAAGDLKKANELREAAAARSIWLAEAQKGLAEFSS